eukprot:6138364-Amphidinium_carterae.1
MDIDQDSSTKNGSHQVVCKTSFARSRCYEFGGMDPRTRYTCSLPSDANCSSCAHPEGVATHLSGEDLQLSALESPTTDFSKEPQGSGCCLGFGWTSNSN